MFLRTQARTIFSNTVLYLFYWWFTQSIQALWSSNHQSSNIVFAENKLDFYTEKLEDDEISWHVSYRSEIITHELYLTRDHSVLDKSDKGNAEISHISNFIYLFKDFNHCNQLFDLCIPLNCLIAGYMIWFWFSFPSK